jgi:hypothetical protein
MRVRQKSPLNFSAPEPAKPDGSFDDAPYPPAEDAAGYDALAAVRSESATLETVPVLMDEPDSPPPVAAATATPASRPEPAPELVAARPEPAEGLARHAYVLAFLVASLWAACVGAYAVGYQGGINAFEFTPFRTTVLVLLAAAPVGLLFAIASLMRQASQLAAESRRARALADTMIAPAARAAGETAQIVRAVRSEIHEAVTAAERARAELSGLREALAMETARLSEASDQAARNARAVTDALASERVEMAQLGRTLDEQAAGVVDAVERQARMVADASDLAQVQLHEAEATLAARAADLAAAAGEAQDAARLAADDLARQTIRLETAGAGVSEQIRAVEEGLSQQRAALVAAAYALRADQEDFSAQVESQRARLSEALTHTRLAAADLGETSTRGAEALRELVQAAADQVRDVAALSDRERADGEERAREALDRFRALAGDVRDELAAETGRALAALEDAAEAARRAADASAEAAQARVDRLAEAAFEAGKRADETFDVRVAAARRLIEESAALVEEAGERSSARLDFNLSALRNALGDVEAALAQIDGRAARLPEEARARVDEIRAAVEDGLGAIASAARKAADETEAVDQIFQERVRRNYDMLNEAVRLMGMVSGGAQPAVAAQPMVAAPEEPPVAERPRKGRVAEKAAAAPEPETAAGAGLRPRLKLTPTQTDEALKTVFEPTAARKEGDGWTWRDLLGGMDDRDAPEALDEDALADRLIEEIEGLGVDPNALLPRTRVEEAAAAYGRGDPEAGRQVVRRVAPAAVRRISRRILTEKGLRAQAERYLGRYERLIEETARGDADGTMIGALLGSAPGRAFLLIDAAVGDML